jgi:HEPN domain-containing protein
MSGAFKEALRLAALAERDGRVFSVLCTHGPEGDFPAAAFHAQQSIEKAIKAVLCLKGAEFRRTHDLIELAGRASDTGASLPVSDDLLRRLTPYGVEFRYDDTAMPLIDATNAARAVEACLAWCNTQLKQGE